MKRKKLVELGEKTKAQYERLLTRAFGSVDFSPGSPFKEDLTTWAPGTRRLLEFAISRSGAERGIDVTPVIDRLPLQMGKRRKSPPKIPAEAEAEAYRQAAIKLPAGKRALALLPLAIGLRASEVLTLPRAQVQRAIKTGELIVQRKGGFEQPLPAEHAKALLAELLDVPSAAIKKVSGAGRPAAWNVVGEILSTGAPHTRYQIYHRLVRDTGKAAGLDNFRPHLLRHAFATRMNRDGAPLATIQHALGHASPATTAIYVHPAAEDVKRFVRPMGLDAENTDE